MRVLIRRRSRLSELHPGPVELDEVDSDCIRQALVPLPAAFDLPHQVLERDSKVARYILQRFPHDRRQPHAGLELAEEDGARTISGRQPTPAGRLSCSQFPVTY